MSKKTIAFKMPTKNDGSSAAENWVTNREVVPPKVSALPQDEPISMKRFTIDVSDKLHKRIKAQCAMRGVKMADIIREMLEREFPE